MHQGRHGEKGISLEELPQRTGLKAELFFPVEEEDVYLRLGPLRKISRPLGVRRGTFQDDPISRDPLIIRRQERTRKLGLLRSKNAPVAQQFYSHGCGKTDRHMEPFFVELFRTLITEEKKNA